MSQGWVRAIVGIVAFFIALPVGLIIAGPQDLTPDPNTGVPVGFNAIIAVIGVALIVGLIAYAATEYAQTKKLESITSQFEHPDDRARSRSRSRSTSSSARPSPPL